MNLKGNYFGKLPISHLPRPSPNYKLLDWSVRSTNLEDNSVGELTIPPPDPQILLIAGWEVDGV